MTVSDEESEEEVEEESDEDGDESEEEESPTQEVNVYTADDLDLDALVRVKIDGEEVDVSFSDLLFTPDGILGAQTTKRSRIQEDHGSEASSLWRQLMVLRAR